MTDRSVLIPCSHVFHRQCLLKWMQNSKTCPQCEKPFDKDKMLELDTNIFSNSNDPRDYPGHFENDFQELQANFEKMNFNSMQEKITEFQAYAVEVGKVVDLISQPEPSITSQRMQTLVNLEADLEKLKKENQDLHQEIENLNDAKTFLSSYCQEDANCLLAYNGGHQYVRKAKCLPHKMALYCCAVHRRLESEKKILQELNEEMKGLKDGLDVAQEKEKNVESINDYYNVRVKTTRLNNEELLFQNMAVIPTSEPQNDVTYDPVEYPEYPNPALGINYKLSGRKSVEISMLDPIIDNFGRLIDREPQRKKDESNSVLGYIKSDGHFSVIVGPERYKNGTIPNLRFIFT